LTVKNRCRHFVTVGFKILGLPSHTIYPETMMNNKLGSRKGRGGGKSKDYSQVATVAEDYGGDDDDDEGDVMTLQHQDDIHQLDVTERTTTTTTTSSDEDNNNNNNNTDGDDDNNHDDNDTSILIITVDDAIERLGTGKFQMIVLVAAGLCFAADAMQVLLLSFLSEVLKEEWHLSGDETAMITSILFVGAIFGTLTLGPLADRIGRKPVFLLAATIISGFGIATAMVTNYWTLLANLFMVGWGVGGLVVPFDILSEFLPANSRGKNLLVIEYFWTIGVLFVVVMAKYTLGDGSGGGDGGDNSHNDDGENPVARWREFVVICTIPCWFSVIIGYCWVPESPRWLCTQGRTDEALDIIRKAAYVNGHSHGDVDFMFPPDGLMRLEDEDEEETNFCELFSPRWRWTTIKLWGAWGFFAFGYYGTIMVITEIFDTGEQQQHSSVSSSEFVEDGGKTFAVTADATPTYSFDYGAIFVSSSAELVGTTFAILSVDVVGRIPLQLISYVLAGVSVCALCLCADNNAHRKVLISLGFAARIFEMVGSCVSWVSTAEILTTEVRTTGHSAANAVARIGSLFAPFLIEGHSSLVKKGLVMLAIHAGTVLFVSQLPETKGSHMGRIAHVSTSDDDDDDDDGHVEETEIIINNESDSDGQPSSSSCRVPSPTPPPSGSYITAAEDNERLIIT
jgi:MFS family permease